MCHLCIKLCNILCSALLTVQNFHDVKEYNTERIVKRRTGRRCLNDAETAKVDGSLGVGAWIGVPIHQNDGSGDGARCCIL